MAPNKRVRSSSEGEGGTGSTEQSTSREVVHGSSLEQLGASASQSQSQPIVEEPESGSSQIVEQMLDSRRPRASSSSHQKLSKKAKLDHPSSHGSSSRGRGTQSHAAGDTSDSELDEDEASIVVDEEDVKGKRKVTFAASSSSPVQQHPSSSSSSSSSAARRRRRQGSEIEILIGFSQDTPRRQRRLRQPGAPVVPATHLPPQSPSSDDEDPETEEDEDDFVEDSQGSVPTTSFRGPATSPEPHAAPPTSSVVVVEPQEGDTSNETSIELPDSQLPPPPTRSSAPGEMTTPPASLDDDDGMSARLIGDPKGRKLHPVPRLGREAFVSPPKKGHSIPFAVRTILQEQEAESSPIEDPDDDEPAAVASTSRVHQQKTTVVVALPSSSSSPAAVVEQKKKTKTLKPRGSQVSVVSSHSSTCSSEASASLGGRRMLSVKNIQRGLVLSSAGAGGAVAVSSTTTTGFLGPLRQRTNSPSSSRRSSIESGAGGFKRPLVRFPSGAPDDEDGYGGVVSATRGEISFNSATSAGAAPIPSLSSVGKQDAWFDTINSEGMRILNELTSFVAAGAPAGGGGRDTQEESTSSSDQRGHAQPRPDEISDVSAGGASGSQQAPQEQQHQPGDASAEMSWSQSGAGGDSAAGAGGDGGGGGDDRRPELPRIEVPTAGAGAEKRAAEEELSNGVAAKKPKTDPATTDDDDNNTANNSNSNADSPVASRLNAPLLPTDGVLTPAAGGPSAGDYFVGSRGVSPAPLSVSGGTSKGPAALVEVIWKCPFIADETKLDLVEFVTDAEKYALKPEAASRLLSKGLWAFQLRAGEKKGILLVHPQKRKYETVRVNEANFATMEITQSLAAPPSKRSATPALDPQPVAPTYMSRDQLEREVEALRQKSEKDAASVAKLKQDVVKLRESNEVDLGMWRDMYSNASNAATERANEASVAEAQVSQLQKQLSTGLAQRELMYKSEIESTAKALDKATAQLELAKQQAANTDLQELRKKAAMYDAMLEAIRLEEEEEMRQERLLVAGLPDPMRDSGDDESDEEDEEDSQEVSGEALGQVFGSAALQEYAGDLGDQDGNTSSLLSCPWMLLGTGAECHEKFATEAEMHAHIKNDHPPMASLELPPPPSLPSFEQPSE